SKNPLLDYSNWMGRFASLCRFDDQYLEPLLKDSLEMKTQVLIEFQDFCYLALTEKGFVSPSMQLLVKKVLQQAAKPRA
ncbi:MAG: hypothetical protein K2X27_06460, partial [Candidatus Obscuribacterales bacterium]|nr:hypothetical protein [Candidatus Obscuribacterales bacterium]